MVIQPAFHDGDYHSAKHVWERAEKAPSGPPVLNWPETSPPKDDDKKKSLAQEEPKKDGKKDGKSAAPTWIHGEPEKVQILEPEAYKHAADNNKPGPRTTFYPERKR